MPKAPTPRSPLFAQTFERARSRPFFVAGRLPVSLSLAELAELLGCAADTAVAVGLCRAPVAGEDLEGWAVAISERWHLEPGRVRALAAQLVD
jgi:hypothetical protein